MENGFAPLGVDGYPVELHHVKGREYDIIVQMTRTNHRGKGEGFHVKNGFKNFIDITTSAEWLDKYI